MNQEFRGFGLPIEWESFLNRHELFFERYHNLRHAMEAAFIRSYIPTAVVDNVVLETVGKRC